MVLIGIVPLANIDRRERLWAWGVHKKLSNCERNGYRILVCYQDLLGLYCCIIIIIVIIILCVIAQTDAVRCGGYRSNNNQKIKSNSTTLGTATNRRCRLIVNEYRDALKMTMNSSIGNMIFSKTRVNIDITSHYLWYTCVVVVISINHSNIAMDTNISSSHLLLYMLMSAASERNTHTWRNKRKSAASSNAVVLLSICGHTLILNAARGEWSRLARIPHNRSELC